MSFSAEVFLHCDGEDTLDSLFRHDGGIKCEMVLGGSSDAEEVERDDYAGAQARLLTRARSEGWVEVEIPALPPSLETLWSTTGGRIGHLCPECERTRQRSRQEESPFPRTAWDEWTEADVKRRAEEIARARAGRP